MEFNVIIPARYASTRLPGKVLLDIGGKSMLQRTYENAVNSGATNVVIATDDERIVEAAKGFDAHTLMTREDHETGAQRCAEAVVALDYDANDIVVNLQADEPLLKPDLIRKVAIDLAEHDNVRVTTLCDEITDAKELFDRDITKVVINRRNYAMYFSRGVIPWELNAFRDEKNIKKLEGPHYRHIGLYAFRVGFLEDFMEWKTSPYEKLESLEQLRILWNGGRIHVTVINEKLPPGVDTPEDLEKIRKMVK